MIDGPDYLTQFAPQCRAAEIVLTDPRIAATVVLGKVDQITMHVNVVGGLVTIHVTVPPWRDQREKAEDRARLAWQHVLHEVAHVIEATDEALFQPNLGMFTFEELARLRTDPNWIDETAARPHMVVELRSQIIQGRLLGEGLTNLDGYADAALTVLGKLNRKTKNSEWRNLAAVLASVAEPADLLVELERKLALASGH